MTYLLALSLLTNLAVIATAFRAADQAVNRAVQTEQADRSQLIATINDLCQRIQAPEQATIDHHARTTPIVIPPSIPFDDDAAWWDATNLTKEQLAAQVNAAELAGTDGTS